MRSKAHESSPEKYVWTTQFNDLRPEWDAPVEQVRRRLQRELLFQMLFQNRIIIRDADLVNQPELLRIIVEDERGFQQSLHSDAVAFGLRQHAANFTEVNQQAGRSRAFPERAELAAGMLGKVDDVLERSASVLSIVESDVGTDHFRDNLERILTYGNLPSPESASLRRAMDSAAGEAADKLLRFGAIFRHLEQVEGFTLESELVQWCRAAHVLIGPQTMGLAPVALDQDLSPEKIRLVLGLRPMEGLGDQEWGTEVPGKILPEDVLDEWTFPQAVALRKLGEAVGYYSALDAVRSADSGSATGQAFVRYVESLDRFLQEIGRQSKIELVSWQADVIERELARRRSSINRVTRGIPVIAAVGGAVTAFLSMGPMAPLAIAAGSGVAVGGLVGTLAGLAEGPLEERVSGRLMRIRKGITTYSNPV